MTKRCASSSSRSSRRRRYASWSQPRETIGAASSKSRRKAVTKKQQLGPSRQRGGPKHFWYGTPEACRTESTSTFEACCADGATHMRETKGLRIVLFGLGLVLAVAMMVSLPSSKVVTSAQLPDPCVSAFTLLKADPANDQTGGPVGENQQLDIQSISVGEDYRYINTEKLVFKMKVAHLNPVPANA